MIAAIAATRMDIQRRTGTDFGGIGFTGTGASVFTGAETGMPPLINNWKMLFIAAFNFKRSIYIFPARNH
jgi:hypothetical protein